MLPAAIRKRALPAPLSSSASFIRISIAFFHCFVSLNSSSKSCSSSRSPGLRFSASSWAAIAFCGLLSFSL